MIGGAGFVNHKWDKEPSWEHIISGLYKRKWAGIHYGPAPVSLKEDEWDSNSGKIDRLNEFVEENRVVSLNYSHPELSGGCYIGRSIDEGDDPMRLIVCDSTCDNPDEAIVDSISLPTQTGKDKIKTSEFDSIRAEKVVQKAIHDFDQNQDGPVELEEFSGKYHILKGFKMDEDDTEWVWNDDFPGIWEMPQQGTVRRKNKGEVHWYIAYYTAVSTDHDLQTVEDIFHIIREDMDNSAADIINGLEKSNLESINVSLGNGEVPEEVAIYALSPGQLEALCEEYLRKVEFPEDFDELITTGGSQGSLSDADIIGISNGKRILAQVSFEADEVEDKINHLANYSDDQPDREVLYFGPGEIKVSENRGEIGDLEHIDEYISIEKLLDMVDEKYKNRLLEVEMSGRQKPDV